MDVDDPSGKDDEERQTEFKEKMENDEKWMCKRRGMHFIVTFYIRTYKSCTVLGIKQNNENKVSTALKEEQAAAKKRAKRAGEEDAYREWIIEERARMSQLAEVR